MLSMAFALLLCFPMLLDITPIRASGVAVKQCEHISHSIREGDCEWNCLTYFGLHNMAPVCLLDGATLLTCTSDNHCISNFQSKLRFGTCDSVMCTVKDSCANVTDWLPKAFTICRAHVKDWNTLLMPGKKKRHDETDSWKCWSIIWAVGTFAVACFVLQCAAFNMYKAKRKRTDRNNVESEQQAEDGGTSLFGQPQVLPSAPPLVHTFGQDTLANRTSTNVHLVHVANVAQPPEAIQPQVVYVSDRPPAYEVVLQLGDHPPPYSSL